MFGTSRQASITPRGHTPRTTPPRRSSEAVARQISDGADFRRRTSEVAEFTTRDVVDTLLDRTLPLDTKLRTLAAVNSYLLAEDDTDAFFRKLSRLSTPKLVGVRLHCCAAQCTHRAYRLETSWMKLNPSQSRHAVRVKPTPCFPSRTAAHVASVPCRPRRTLRSVCNAECCMLHGCSRCSRCAMRRRGTRWRSSRCAPCHW